MTFWERASEEVCRRLSSYWYISCAIFWSRFLECFADKDNAPTTVTVLDNILRPLLHSGHDVSDTGFCLRLQVFSAETGNIPPEDGDTFQSPLLGLNTT
jgi:hypothetical protein